MKEAPLITILCFTYNQEGYIESAINGFLNQRTDYSLEILIHDDASTDRTPEILSRYEKEYPDVIRVFYEKENQYSKGALFNAMKDHIRGQLIAICEGDDFWCDPNKLQMQVEYMEEHKDCMITGTNGLQWDCRTNTMVSTDGFPREQDVSMEEILFYRKSCFPTASFVMRREVYYMEDFYRGRGFSDWMHLLYARSHGKVHYFDRITCVYRFYAENSWTSRTYTHKGNYVAFTINMISFFEAFDANTSGRYHEIINNMVEGFIRAGASMYDSKDDNGIQEQNDYVKSKIKQGDLPYLDVVNRGIIEIAKCKQDVVAFASGNCPIYIMGTGNKDGESVAELLDENNIAYEGFVVSDGQVVKEEFHGKKVYHLSDIIKKEKDPNIVISINRRYKTEIEDILNKNGVRNYCWSWI